MEDLGSHMFMCVSLGYLYIREHMNVSTYKDVCVYVCEVRRTIVKVRDDNIIRV